MRRFFARRLAFDLAAALLVVFVVVSVADIEDYGVRSRSALSSFDFSDAPIVPPEFVHATADEGSDCEHHCRCPLCVVSLPRSPGPRIAPRDAGTMPTPSSPTAAGSPHVSEVFHPPQA